ncbi:AbrB/MazE/SpoVT family DNA-binding domain-containing protein [Paenibacillus apiarius]|uniref:AbrB/MazE/SpoVT family DNA-binding domain-containing protein n=1 Tax=Paenibacillus apiarius TaxID=46240 RepID=A0ABT4DQ44_9BACL|nr:AbrB/MazE/SpoVT family DNA-binding domain-containing protein [Paenibacillus apiarius]MCY9515577.1 AbrB/MazE/SpoVT family DNA-binding domain-containing protein [Paenibacillus apiarius]MCY9519350.1 AbrB/MazE/SpoVT family DNA-binding domain-containing protein [Paenibacillus apiarius]MCY9550986.1 AbrB/MazE/SpoVT family DNA-binding domain-containing protein [Paenibacillus apiarius]MCY9558922.1 AbrB/MazE/SpoVT family DNA-binding domain-containing protein [Paenibacillus apiarius]MCY9683601.1 AbrB/
MKKRKLLRIGNSYGLILPKEILSKLHAQYGDTFEMEVKEQTGELIIRKIRHAETAFRPKCPPLTS